MGAACRDGGGRRETWKINTRVGGRRKWEDEWGREQGRINGGKRR